MLLGIIYNVDAVGESAGMAIGQRVAIEASILSNRKGLKAQCKKELEDGEIFDKIWNITLAPNWKLTAYKFFFPKSLYKTLTEVEEWRKTDAGMRINK